MKIYYDWEKKKKRKIFFIIGGDERMLSLYRFYSDSIIKFLLLGEGKGMFFYIRFIKCIRYSLVVMRRKDR